jgi:hypothetical protein
MPTTYRLLVMLFALALPFLSAAEDDAAEDGAAKRKKPERHASGITHAGKPEGSGKAFRLFIMSGQSNMAGLPEQLSFIPDLEAAYPDDEILIVKDSLSGQPIRRWAKNWQPVEGWTPKNNRDKPGNNDLYERLMELVKEGVGERRPDSIAFVWMQGEADAKSGQSPQYADALRGLVGQVREDLGRPDVVAVIGRISDCEVGQPNWDEVRVAQVAVAENDLSVAWVDTDDLNGDNNALHYTLDGYAKLGQRFAEQAVSLLAKSAAKP